MTRRGLQYAIPTNWDTSPRGEEGRRPIKSQHDLISGRATDRLYSGVISGRSHTEETYIKKVISGAGSVPEKKASFTKDKPHCQTGHSPDN